jgi:TolB protein
LVWLGCLACNSNQQPTEQAKTVGPEASAAEIQRQLGPRLGGDRELAKLDVRGERALLGTFAPLRADTDQQPEYELWVWEPKSAALRSLRHGVRSAALGNDCVFAVTAAGGLVRIDGRGERSLTDGAIGRPAPRADGSVAIARDHGDLGESDVWLVRSDGTARVLAAAPGPDDLPIALPGDRVAFVSGRTGIASLWTVDVRTGATVQLTNRGLSIGKPLTDLVPPPVKVESVDDKSLIYDAGDGERWRVDLDTGAAARQGDER